MRRIIFFVALFIGQIINAQCAMCKAVVENGDVSVAEGINNGITYLMVFPYLLIGGLFFAIYRYRKQQVKN
ncbi:hypothetical protein [Polaribacter sp. M15]